MRAYDKMKQRHPHVMGGEPTERDLDLGVGTSAAKGAISGAAVGGPWGALIGGAVGAGAGLLKKKKAKS